MIFDDVLIPWENVLFYRHTKAASFIRATLHRYSAFAFVQRNLKLADMMIGAALFNARQTGLDKQQAVQEKLAQLAVYREGINAHLTGADRARRAQPGGTADAQSVAALHRPGAGLLAAARDDAHRARAVRRPDLRDAGQGGVRCARDQALARQILFGERALGRRGPPQAARLRARPAELRLRRSPADASSCSRSRRPFAHLAAVYRNFDWDGPLQFRAQRSRPIRAGAWSARRAPPAIARSSNGTQRMPRAPPARSLARLRRPATRAACSACDTASARDLDGRRSAAATISDSG